MPDLVTLWLVYLFGAACGAVGCRVFDYREAKRERLKHDRST